MQFDLNLLDLLGITEQDLQDILEALNSYLLAMILLVALLIIIKWQGIRVGDKILIGTDRGTIQIILMGCLDEDSIICVGDFIGNCCHSLVCISFRQS